jgi:hypothetical protein
MDREAAVIRAEMTQTRAELDYKLRLLEARARAFRPDRYAARYLPDYPLDRLIGALLTAIGIRMVMGRILARRRRERLRAAMAAYGCWHA